MRTSENSPSTHSGEKGLTYPSVIYIEPWVTLNLLGVGSYITTKGGRADERASQKGKAQKYPTVGAGALLQQRAHGGGPRLLRRRSHLLRAQGQGQRHSALHLRDDRGPEDSGGRRVLHTLPGGVEIAQLRRRRTRRASEICVWRSSEKHCSTRFGSNVVTLHVPDPTPDERSCLPCLFWQALLADPWHQRTQGPESARLQALSVSPGDDPVPLALVRL